MQRREWDRRWRRNLTGPPRHVPVWVRLRLLFGGFSNQFGWLLFGFGLTFIWAFGASVALKNYAFFRGELAEAPGSITTLVDARLSINNRRVFEFHYRYEVTGKTYRGYTRGYEGAHQPGEHVIIEHRPDHPQRSRVRGLTTAGNGSFLMLVFPITGLVFVAFGVRKGLKGRRLLRDGVVAAGTQVGRERTCVKVDQQPVYRFTYEFEAQDQKRYRAEAKTHVVRRFAGNEEPLVYNPHDPRDAVLLDDLPGGPRIDEQGTIHGSVFPVLPLLVVPGVTVIGHGWWVLHLLECV
jgi:hypothetical protein